MASITMNYVRRVKADLCLFSKMKNVGSHQSSYERSYRRKKREASNVLKMQKKKKHSKVKLPFTDHVFLFLLCCWLVSVWFGCGESVSVFVYLCLSIITWPCTSLLFTWQYFFPLGLGHMFSISLLCLHWNT